MNFQSGTILTGPVWVCCGVTRRGGRCILMWLMVTRWLRQTDFQAAGVATRVAFDLKAAIGCPPGQAPVVRMKKTVEVEKPHGCVSYFGPPEFNNVLAVVSLRLLIQTSVDVFIRSRWLSEYPPAPEPYSEPADLMCQKLKKVSPDFADFCKKILLNSSSTK